MAPCSDYQINKFLKGKTIMSESTQGLLHYDVSRVSVYVYTEQRMSSSYPVCISSVIFS